MTQNAAPPSRTGEKVMAVLARLLTRVFFRRIEVAGAEQLPDHGPVILVANHVNGLVDGLVLMAALARYPRFLGKSTLFKIVPLAPFLRLAGVVPVYRASDGGGTDRNAEAFGTARALLGAGAMVAIFPEGVSHDDAYLHPLRTGAARIALGADVGPLRVVPVGLIYEEKARFRSRALVRIGAPFTVDGGRAGAGDGHHSAAAVRELTARIGSSLAAVAPMYGSRQDELVFQQAAGVLWTTHGHADHLADRDAVARRLAAGAPEGIDGLREAMARYDEQLSLLGLTDAQVAAGLSETGYRRRRARRLTLLVAAAPVAATGAVLHAAPYAVMKQVGKRPPNEGIRATVKLLGCFVLFTTMYTTIGVTVGRRRGALAGAAAFAAGPLSGYVTVRFAEEVSRAGGVARARALLAPGDERVSRLMARRSAVVSAARAVLAPMGEPAM